jgi:hypothetical protein
VPDGERALRGDAYDSSGSHLMSPGCSACSVPAYAWPPSDARAGEGVADKRPPAVACAYLVKLGGDVHDGDADFDKLSGDPAMSTGARNTNSPGVVDFDRDSGEFVWLWFSYVWASPGRVKFVMVATARLSKPGARNRLGEIELARFSGSGCT